MIKNNEQQTIIEFGTGDVKITSGMIGGVAVLGLRNQTENKTIGSLSRTNETAETLPNSEVYMVFNSLKSIEVMILKLQQARSIVINDITTDYTEQIEDITEIYEPNKFLKG